MPDTIDNLLAAGLEVDPRDGNLATLRGYLATTNIDTDERLRLLRLVARMLGVERNKARAWAGELRRECNALQATIDTLIDKGLAELAGAEVNDGGLARIACSRVRAIVGARGDESTVEALRRVAPGMENGEIVPTARLAIEAGAFEVAASMIEREYDLEQPDGAEPPDAFLRRMARLHRGGEVQS